jgi:hypothetical protein
MHSELIGRGTPASSRVPAAAAWWLYLHDYPTPNSESELRPRRPILAVAVGRKHVPRHGPATKIYSDER